MESPCIQILVAIIVMSTKKKTCFVILYFCFAFKSISVERISVFSLQKLLNTVLDPPNIERNAHLYVVRHLRGGRVIYGTLPAKSKPELRALNLQVTE